MSNCSNCQLQKEKSDQHIKYIQVWLNYNRKFQMESRNGHQIEYHQNDEQWIQNFPSIIKN